jgi:D-xylose transport system substrate-binding protein
MQLISGTSIQASTVMFDGTYYVPYEKLSPIMVTRGNIDEIIIEGGFHRREQVYLNLN